MTHWSTSPEQSSSVFCTSQPLELHHPWNCFCQAGDRGIVFDGKGGYDTAFFEAFPREPLSTFIRGEGKDIVEAEEAGWREWQKNLACGEHEWERRGYRNGAGFCKKCGAFKPSAFDPLEKCVVCGKATYYHEDAVGDWYCKEHVREIPLVNWTDVDWIMAYKDNVTWDWKHKTGRYKA